MRQAKALIICSSLFMVFLLLWTPGYLSSAGNATAPGYSFIGERLFYKIEWDPPWYMFFLPSLEAGEAEIHLIGETQYKNRKAIKATLTVHSSGALAKLSGIKFDDEFLLYTESESFCAIDVFQKIREPRRKRQINVEYLRETHQLSIYELDESVDPPRVRKNEKKDNIPPCVHDPLSALCLFRMSKIGENFSQIYIIGNDDKIQEVQAVVEKREVINSFSGKMNAWRVTTNALKGQLFRASGQLKLWISADERRLPLQFEAKIPLGHVLCRLKSVR
jgi:hypothetical protein